MGDLTNVVEIRMIQGSDCNDCNYVCEGAGAVE